MQSGGDGQTLHGGAHERYRAGGFLEGYQFHAGKMVSAPFGVSLKSMVHSATFQIICLLSPSMLTFSNSLPGWSLWSGCLRTRAPATVEWQWFRAGLWLSETNLFVVVE